MSKLPIFAVGSNLLLAGLQPALFLSGVSNGQALDLSPYRVDSLSLALGVTCAVAAALASTLSLTTSHRWSGFSALAISICMLNVVYAREMWWLYIWLEIGALVLWMSFRPLSHGVRQVPSFVLYLSGLPLLLVVLLGQAKSFAPPAGGVTQPWPLIGVIAFGVVMLRSASLVVLGLRDMNGGNPHNVGNEALAGLYVLFMPALLARALVAAPWEPVGTWTLALLGTIGLLGAIGTAVFSFKRTRAAALAFALASLATIAFGLAPGSPLAAAGGLAVMLAGSLCVPLAVAGIWGQYRAFILLMGAFAGLWLISQAALNMGYGVVTALTLPCLLALTVVLSRNETLKDIRSMAAIASGSLIALILIIGATYPQIVVQMVLRPAVQTMAGGVPALSTLRVDPGVGLLVLAPQGTILASLPATGIAVAVLLTFVTLYWLKKLLMRFARIQTEAPAE